MAAEGVLPRAGELLPGARRGRPVSLARGVHVVTGAAGGIGLATAEALVAAGATVALADRDVEPLDGHAVLRDAAIGLGPGPRCQPERDLPHLPGVAPRAA
ncbi:SDR family NAD(P)-dependent oxidoreductase [Actinoallomurus acaciae]|uniref:SDR family NAD(P)-dependent oxidoreductase n=1 Tax=Actinoallomurus acaciae TaxID=502577 RepID=A0ABV5Y9I4_9ACTN